MNEEINLIICDECGEAFENDEILHFSPENDSNILRVCESCYDKLDEKLSGKNSKNFYS